MEKQLEMDVKCTCEENNHVCGKISKTPGIESANVSEIAVESMEMRNTLAPIKIQGQNAEIEIHAEASAASKTDELALKDKIELSDNEAMSKLETLSIAFTEISTKEDIAPDGQLDIPTRSLLGSSDTTPDVDQLPLPSTFSGSSDTTPDAELMSGTSKCHSVDMTSEYEPIEVENPLSQKDAVPVEKQKSSSPQRPTDIDIGVRLTFHQFSTSEADGILKCSKYLLPEGQPQAYRPKSMTEPSNLDQTSKTKVAGSPSPLSESKSHSTSRSVDSCPTSIDNLTGSSDTSDEIAAADITYQKMRSGGPKINITWDFASSSESTSCEKVSVPSASLPETSISEGLRVDNQNSESSTENKNIRSDQCQNTNELKGAIIETDHLVAKLDKPADKSETSDKK